MSETVWFALLSLELVLRFAEKMPEGVDRCGEPYQRKFPGHQRENGFATVGVRVRDSHLEQFRRHCLREIDRSNFSRGIRRGMKAAIEERI